MDITWKQAIVRHNGWVLGHRYRRTTSPRLTKINNYQPTHITGNNTGGKPSIMHTHHPGLFTLNTLVCSSREVQPLLPCNNICTIMSTCIEFIHIEYSKEVQTLTPFSRVCPIEPCNCLSTSNAVNKCKINGVCWTTCNAANMRADPRSVEQIGPPAM